MAECRLCSLTRGVVLRNEYWTMAVNENQATLGRVFFALRRHETDAIALTQEELLSLWAFAREAKAALAALFQPDHYNMLFHMNIDPHVHMHIYPRYGAERLFGGETYADSRYADHYDPAQIKPLNAAGQEALAAALRHEMTQPSRKQDS